MGSNTVFILFIFYLPSELVDGNERKNLHRPNRKIACNIHFTGNVTYLVCEFVFICCNAMRALIYNMSAATGYVHVMHGACNSS